MPPKPKRKSGAGRPSKQADVPFGAIEALCQFNPTKGQVLAGLLMMGHKVSDSTLDRVIKANTGGNFDDLRDKKTDGTRLKLIQTAIGMANNKDRTMLIFCLKNLCGWSDNANNANSVPIKVMLGYDPDSDE